MVVRVGGPAQSEAAVEPEPESSWDGETDDDVGGEASTRHEALEAVSAALTPPVEFAGAKVFEVPEGARVYSASSMGECTTALVARGIGYPAADMPEVLGVALEEGNRNEPVILDRLTRWHLRGADEDGNTSRTKWRVYVPGDYAALGIELGEYDPERDVDYTLQPRVWLPVTKTAVLRAHLDGIAAEVKQEQDGGRRVVEAKAFGDGYWGDFQHAGLAAFPGYEWQVSVQMYAAGFSLLGVDAGKDYMRALFVVGHKANEEMAKLHRCAKGDVFEIAVVKVDEPPVKYGEILKRVLGVEQYVKKQELPKCVEGRWPCAYFQLGECEGKPKVEAETVDDEEFVGLCREYWTVSQDEKSAKSARASLRETIEKWLEAHPEHAGKKLATKDEAGNEYVFEWVTREMPERTMKAGTQSYPQVKLVGGK